MPTLTTLNTLKLRLVVTLHPGGEAVCSYAEVDESPAGYRISKVTSQAQVAAELSAMGFTEEAKTLRAERPPVANVKEIEFYLPKSDEVLITFGLKD